MSDAIVLKGVTKVFAHPMKVWQKVTAVSDASFSVKRGEITGLVGHNGAGKTTSIKMIMGFIRPTAGEISVLGKQPGSPDVLSKVGFLPERPYFFEHLTPWEILGYFGSLSGIPSKKLKEAKNRVLKQVDLYDARNRPLHSFSKGMLQRIGLAQAIMHNPDLVILDEPMSGLDPIGRKEVKDIILDLKKQGKSVILSSHILSDIELLSDKIVVLERGKVKAWGMLQDIIPDSAVRWVILFSAPESDRDALFAELDDIESRDSMLAIVKKNRDEMNQALEFILKRGYTIYSAGPHYPTLEEVVFDKREVQNA